MKSLIVLSSFRHHFIIRPISIARKGFQLIPGSSMLDRRSVMPSLIAECPSDVALRRSALGGSTIAARAVTRHGGEG